MGSIGRVPSGDRDEREVHRWPAQDAHQDLPELVPYRDQQEEQRQEGLIVTTPWLKRPAVTGLFGS